MTVTKGIEELTPESLWTAVQGRVFLCGSRETFKESFLFVLTSALYSSDEAGKPVVKGLDDSALVKLMYKHLPPKVADDLTIDKHPPMFPQAEYSVPTLSARNFVDALLSALSTPADIEPVAWRCAMGDQYWHYFTKEPRHKEPGEVWQPLYAAPVADREPVIVPEVEALAETLCETFAAADPGDDGTGKAWPYAREWEKASWRAVAKAALFAAAPQPNPSKVDATVERLTIERDALLTERDALQANRNLQKAIAEGQTEAVIERCAQMADEHANQCRAKLNKKRSDHDLAVFESAMSEANSIACSIRALAAQGEKP